MLIIREEIVREGLVSPANQIKLKNSTCDLTIGRIFPMGEDISDWDSGLDQFLLAPSHMVTVMTTQKLSLPNHITGLATLVTSLTQEGILCLNTGIVDPGYEGHLSATLVNFSSIPRPIKLNDRLFRVVFLPHRQLSDDELEPFENKKATYEVRIRSKTSQEFSETFLNVKGILSLAREEAWKIVWITFLNNYVPVLALLAGVVGSIFGVLAFFK